MVEREVVFQTLKTIRGDYSQVELSKDLGFSFNQVGKWEAGVKKIYYKEFCKICDKFEFDLAKATSKVFDMNYDGHESFHKSLKNISDRHFFGREKELASKLGIKTSKLKAILVGREDIDLYTYFKFIEVTTAHLEDYLNYLLNKKSFEQLKGSSFCRLIAESADFAVVYCALTTSVYLNASDSSLAISKITGIREDKVRYILHHLEENEVIKFNGKHLVPQTFKTDINKVQQKALLSLFHSILDKFYAKTDASNLGASFRVIPVSEDLAQEVHNIIRNAYSKISALTEKEDNEKKTKVLGFVVGAHDYSETP